MDRAEQTHAEVDAIGSEGPGIKAGGGGSWPLTETKPLDMIEEAEMRGADTRPSGEGSVRSKKGEAVDMPGCCLGRRAAEASAQQAILDLPALGGRAGELASERELSLTLLSPPYTPSSNTLAMPSDSKRKHAATATADAEDEVHVDVEAIVDGAEHKKGGGSSTLFVSNLPYTGLSFISASV